MSSKVPRCDCRHRVPYIFYNGWAFTTGCVDVGVRACVYVHVAMCVYARVYVS